MLRRPGSIKFPNLKLANKFKIKANQDYFLQIIQTKGIEESFYIADFKHVIDQYSIWQQALPNVTPFYAVKCNDNPVYLQYLKDLGLSFDCASGGELSSIIGIGVNPNNIVYSHPIKSNKDIRFANEVNVNLTVVDTIDELEKIKQFHPNTNILIRLKVPNIGSIIDLNSKFGVTVELLEPLLDKAKSLQLNIIGISYHVGSGCNSTEGYTKAVELASFAFQKVKAKGYDCYLLNIGGGYPGNDNETFNRIAVDIQKSLQLHFKCELNNPNFKIISEPGTYMVQSCFALACQVIGKRVDQTTNTIEYYLNNSVYGSFMDEILIKDSKLILNRIITIDKFNNLQSLSIDHNMNNQKKCKIWGQTCDSLDLISGESSFPEMKLYDWVIAENKGAYALSLNTLFNGFLPPKIYYCNSYDIIDDNELAIYTE